MLSVSGYIQPGTTKNNTLTFLSDYLYAKVSNKLFDSRYIDAKTIWQSDCTRVYFIQQQVLSKTLSKKHFLKI